MGAGAGAMEQAPSDNNGQIISPVKPFKSVTPGTPAITFDVALGFWPGTHIALPALFKLRISYESLDFVKKEDDTPLIQFPFQNIICWGSSHQNFQFKIFDFENADPEKSESGILISLKTTQGRLIEDATMSTVEKLMDDMKARAISKQEFAVLLSTVLSEDGTELHEDWMHTIEQFTLTGRQFLAKQGMEILLRIGNIAPFEKFELACMLYERIINKNSFQLILNTFDDQQERENLIYRLKLNKKEFVADCSIMPEPAQMASPPPSAQKGKVVAVNGKSTS